MVFESRPEHEREPDQLPLTSIQATRLAQMTGLEAKALVGTSVREIAEKFRWRIDPQILLFRRICGRVVKRDPVTGVEYPVPFATVIVEDTDCNVLWYFPPSWPWGWLLPLACRREVIGQTITDACGRFCVWVPRWEIDWILRFRKERLCLDFPLKPSLRDLLDDLVLVEHPPFKLPIPEPDPPFLLRDGGMTLRRAEEILGRPAAAQLTALEVGLTLGERTMDRQHELLSRDAFVDQIHPPLPADLQSTNDLARSPKLQKLMAGLAARYKLGDDFARRLDLRQFIGPFRRCVDIIVPEWLPIIDVPDITFRVTQDVDGDGDQETIYSEGYFDVRWNAGSIPDVTLYAGPAAIAGLTCDAPPVICQDEPAITFAGLMPLINPPLPDEPYHDAAPGEASAVAPGYARRPNRPHPSGAINDPAPNPRAETPYTGTLLLFGCNELPGAVFYRLRYSRNGAPFVPFAGLTWPLYRLVGGVLDKHFPSSDADGWYPILSASQGWSPEHLLLSWPTTSFANGLYTIQLELGNAAKSVVQTSAPIRIRVDNTAPQAHFTGLAWRVAGTLTWTPLELICPVVSRPMSGGMPVNIEFKVDFQVAAEHLRSIVVSGGGCGGGAPEIIASPGGTWENLSANSTGHWHMHPDTDNAEAGTVIFGVAGSSLPGAYSFMLVASSRAFNPSSPAGFTADWEFDPVINYVTPSLPVAIVNA